MGFVSSFIQGFLEKIHEKAHIRGLFLNVSVTNPRRYRQWRSIRHR